MDHHMSRITTSRSFRRRRALPPQPKRFAEAPPQSSDDAAQQNQHLGQKQRVPQPRLTTVIY